MIKVNHSIGLIVLAAAVAACGVSDGFAARGAITIQNADIVGAGATFPAPLYQRWIKEYLKSQTGYSLFYDAVGSGAGTKRFMAGEVDFGASDSAMRDEQMEGVKNGVQLIPATAGIIVLGYNLPGVTEELRLSRQAYTDIFLGKIKNWNDKRLHELNPKVQLPNLNIVTVTRSDSSGTTWAFTNHLSAISNEWRDQGPGVGKKVDWPGNSMVGRYNEGVAAKISHAHGSIGYVEYGIAKRAGLAMATLENQAGHYVAPTGTSGTATLANTSMQMPANLRMFLPDPAGSDSYPIITYTWLLLYKNYPEKTTADRVKQFVHWGLSDGQAFAEEYGYTPLPGTVVESALKALETVR